LNKREKEAQQVFLDNEKAVLKKLENNYKDALSEINSKIELLMSRQDADMQHVIYQVEYQKALKKQVEAILETLHSNEFETVSEYLTKSYEDGFITTMYNLQGQGIPLIFPIDQEQVVNAIQHETKLSESLYAKLGLDTKDLSKKIAGEISRGLSGGQMYSEIARNIAGWAMIPKNNAMRIARTEAHRIQTRASMNACDKAKSKGAEVVKQWDASLDKRTRDSHRDVDGEIRELDEPFSNGLMYPGDPSGSAAEVVNCRCALLQRARWALGNDYTKWSPDAPVLVDDDGTTQFAIIEAKNYKEFQKKYAQASERVRESVQKMNNEDVLENIGKNVTMELLADINKMITPYERKVLDAVPKKEGFFDFAAHGSPVNIEYGSSDTVLTAREVARIIKHNESYHGEKVRLLSCSTGSKEDGFAQQLANALGVEVEAPSDVLIVSPDGKYKVGYDGSGKMVTFKPNGKERYT
jgi:SPP1 gp7 family putative phage head morphogenesis protein